MVVRKTIGENVFDIFNYIFMIFMILITLYPFYYIINCSLSNSNFLIGDKGFMLLPKDFNLDAYVIVFKNPNIQSGYRNTLFVLIIGTILNIIMTSLGAFLLTRKNFAIKNAMAYMMIFTMYFSGGMIPAYLLINNVLSLGNNLLALIIPVSINTYNLIIMRTNFANIPDSIEESAKIDGANDFIVLFRIVLPLSIPIIAVMVLFYGVFHWNSWFSAMLYIRDRTLYPLQLILREILLLNSTGTMMQDTASTDRYTIGESIKYATIIVATIPILCAYPFIQRYFVKGIMIGAVKG
jgi:putative aldouronate transport system permease protein